MARRGMGGEGGRHVVGMLLVHMRPVYCVVPYCIVMYDHCRLTMATTYIGVAGR